MIKMILEHVSNRVKGSRHKFGWLFFQVFTVPILLPNKEENNKRTFYRLEKVGEITHVCIIAYFTVEA